MSYKNLHRFNDLLLHYQGIERVVYIPGTSRWENDVEHSYTLAMLAWYIIARDGLSLDTGKILKYALVHDLVEVYAGDTYLYDPKARETKHEREVAAQLKLKENFPEFEELHAIIAVYESQKDPESRFIRALDKLHPMLLIYADGGRLWQEKKITLDMLVDAKQSIIDSSPEIKPYFDSLVAHLRTRPELFPKFHEDV